jgi:hypothetical protein
MPNMTKIGKTATSVVEDANGVQVRYHDTIVFEKHGFEISVRHGGWVTATTQRRINQAFYVYGVLARAYIKDGKLLIERWDGRPTLTVPSGSLNWTI